MHRDAPTGSLIRWNVLHPTHIKSVIVTTQLIDSINKSTTKYMQWLIPSIVYDRMLNMYVFGEESNLESYGVTAVPPQWDVLHIKVSV